MDSSGEKEDRYLLVQAGGVDYLLPLVRVQQVVAALRLYPFPGAAPAVVGLAQLGGEPMVVLDLARLAGGPGGGHGEAAMAVIARVGPAGQEETVALAVDAALEVVQVAPHAIASGGAGAIGGEAVVGDLTPRVVNLEAVGAAP